MTIGSKITFGFGSLLFLCCLGAAMALIGVSNVAEKAADPIVSNRIEAKMWEVQVGHAHWADQVTQFLMDPEVTELTVETDPHQCTFGRWYYGPGREEAESWLPSLKPILDALEEPHSKLHQSAREIKRIHREAHGDLALRLLDIRANQLSWELGLERALRQVLASPDTAADFTLEVSSDPTSCSLGLFLHSPEAKQWASRYPAFAQFRKTVEAPHTAHHESALEIQELVRQGSLDQAMSVFEEKTKPALAAVDSALHQLVEAERVFEDAHRNALEVFETETRPARTRMHDLLTEVQTESADHAVSDEEMLATARTTRWALILLCVVGACVGLGSAVWTAKSITGPLSTVVGTLAAGAEQSAASAEQISAASQSLAQGASEQAALLEEVGSSMEEMSSMVSRDAEVARRTNQHSREANEAAAEGVDSMSRLRNQVQAVSSASTEMEKAMNSIKESSDSVSKIIKTIDEIAFQTNILALNAAVEAARAGQAGAGFAVVADEVRNLARRAAEAAGETAAMIEDSVQRSARGVQVNASVGASLKEVFAQSQAVEQNLHRIADRASQVSQSMDELEASLKEQDEGVRQINDAISQANTVTQATAASSEEAASASEEMSAQALSLMEVVDGLNRMVRKNRKADADHPKSLRVSTGHESRPTSAVTKPPTQSRNGKQPSPPKGKPEIRKPKEHTDHKPLEFTLPGDRF